MLRVLLVEMLSGLKGNSSPPTPIEYWEMPVPNFPRTYAWPVVRAAAGEATNTIRTDTVSTPARHLPKSRAIAQVPSRRQQRLGRATGPRTHGSRRCSPMRRGTAYREYDAGRKGRARGRERRNARGNKGCGATRRGKIHTANQRLSERSRRLAPARALSSLGDRRSPGVCPASVGVKSEQAVGRIDGVGCLAWRSDAPAQPWS